MSRDYKCPKCGFTSPARDGGKCPNGCGSLAAMPGSVKVKRLEYAWQIERPNSIDIVRHTLRSASEPSLNYHEQIIGCLCAALSQNDQGHGRRDHGSKTENC